MTSAVIRQPAIALVDDDFHSARLMLRMLAAHDAPLVDWLVYGGEEEGRPLPVGFPSAAGIPPHVAHVPMAITAAAPGARRSIHSITEMTLLPSFLPGTERAPSPTQ